MRYAVALMFIAAPAFAQDAAVAITNAVVETMTPAGRIDKATVVVRNGKIEAVGKDVKVPDDAKVIDAAGGTVMPGLIEPHFEVAIASTPTESAAPRTIVIRGQVITLPANIGAPRAAFTRVADNFYPYDAGYKPLPRAGFTHLNLVTSGLGQSAGVRVTPKEPERMLSRPDGVAYATVTNTTESLDGLRQRLEGVAAANRPRPGGAAGPVGPGGPGGVANPGLSPANTQLWKDVVAGKVPLVLNVANAATVLHVLKIAESYKDMKLVLLLAADAVFEAVDAMRGKKLSVVVKPAIDLSPNNRDRFLAAKVLHQAGIDFAFTLAPRLPEAANPLAGLLGNAPQAASGDANVADQDFPLFAVAMQVKGGLPRQVALESLTRRPAVMLGLGETHGTVTAGKAADLLLYSGDPLDPAGRLRLTRIEGRTVYEN